MRHSDQIGGTGRFTIIVLNLFHYLVLGLLGLVSVMVVLVFLTHDADHPHIRARIDHIYEVWAAPHGAAERKLRQNGSLASEAAK